MAENLNDLPMSVAKLEIKHTTQHGIKYIYLPYLFIYLFINNEDWLVGKLVYRTWEPKIPM